MDGLDDIFDEDVDNEEIIKEEEIIFDPKNEEIFEDNKSSLILELLKGKGLENSEITVLDEDDNESKIDFFSLSMEEQLEILKDSEEKQVSSFSASSEEEKFLSKLREEKVGIDEYLENYKKSILSESENTGQAYNIDSYDDNELYLLDLKAKYDLSDEELEKELTRALEDEELFKKKIVKTRQEYKDLEDQFKKDEEDKFEKDNQLKYEEFSNTMINSAVKNSEYYGIELEDSEKNSVLSDLLELDDKGISKFYRDISNPDKLFEVAWFSRYGKDAFSALQNAYESEIARLKKDVKKPVVIKKNNDKKDEWNSVFN